MDVGVARGLFSCWHIYRGENGAANDEEGNHPQNRATAAAGLTNRDGENQRTKNAAEFFED